MNASPQCQATISRGFTLTELLVAMAIIVVIAGITAVGVRTLARDAKMSSAINTVIAGLDTARGIAIRDNRLTVLAFRPRVDGNRQYVELVIAQWTGESPSIMVNFTENQSLQVVDRYELVPGIAPRRLPIGIKVAGPRYQNNLDKEWTTQTHLPSQPTEVMGRLIGVLFAPDGTVVTRNSASDNQQMFVDFNADGIQQISTCATCPNGQVVYSTTPTSPPTVTSDTFGFFLMLQREPDDEPFVTPVPFLAIFDDDAARADGDPSTWNDIDNYVRDLTGPGDFAAGIAPGYITRNADRIHFNRYTGVVMR